MPCGQQSLWERCHRPWVSEDARRCWVRVRTYGVLRLHPCHVQPGKLHPHIVVPRMAERVPKLRIATQENDTGAGEMVNGASASSGLATLARYTSCST